MTLDVTKAIMPKSDQLNADSLITGPRTIKVRDVQVNATAEQPIWVFFDGDDGKPWKPCKTSARCMAAIWGADATQWIGMHCTLFMDPTVTWGGAAVGGIRVSHMEGIDRPRVLQLTKTRGKKGAVTIQPLVIDDAPRDEIDTDAVHAEARLQAKNGRDKFIAWWKTKPEWKDTISAIMPELQKSAAEADTPPVDDEEVPM